MACSKAESKLIPSKFIIKDFDTQQVERCTVKLVLPPLDSVIGMSLCSFITYPVPYSILIFN